MPKPVHTDETDTDVTTDDTDNRSAKSDKSQQRVKADANKKLYAYRLVQGQRVQRDVTAEPDDNGNYPKETITAGMRFYSFDNQIAKRDGPDRTQYLGEVKNKEAVFHRERQRKGTLVNPPVVPDRNTRSMTDQQTNAAKQPINLASELTQDAVAEKGVRNDDPDGTDDPRFKASGGRATNSGGTEGGPLEEQFGDFEDKPHAELKSICDEVGVKVRGKQTKEAMISALRERDQQMTTERDQEKGNLEKEQSDEI